MVNSKNLFMFYIYICYIYLECWGMLKYLLMKLINILKYVCKK